MSEQRHVLIDAYVLAVPAEYAGTGSGGDDYQQQYYPYRLKLTTFEERDVFPIFFIVTNQIFFLP